MMRIGQQVRIVRGLEKGASGEVITLPLKGRDLATVLVGEKARERVGRAYVVKVCDLEVMGERVGDYGNDAVGAVVRVGVGDGVKSVRDGGAR